MKALRALAVAAALTLSSGVAAVAAELPPVTATDRVLGQASAPVTVVEYASFTCPHCADWHTDVLPEFKTRYIDTGKVRLVYRDLPTQPAEASQLAALVVRCSAPDKAFDVIGLLMTQREAAALMHWPMGWFVNAIEVSGKSMEEVQACVQGPEAAAGLQTDVQAAIAAGVEGTPTFFVNGRRMENGDLATLSAAIDPLLAGR